MAPEEMMREQAIAWAVRTGDPAFDGWEEFTAWLEQHPAHARAYDEVVAAVADGAESLPPERIAHNDDEPAAPVRRRWFGGVVALAVAVVAGFGAWQMRTGTYAIDTAPGATQLVELDGGGMIELGGGSRIVLDRGDPRQASLERGQALFVIEHDAASPFMLTVGDDTLVDVGTTFDVKRMPEGIVLAVSEGAVVFNPKRQNVQVSPGEMLTSRAGSDQYRLSAVPVEEVGEWRQGRLTFHDASLAAVAADLNRATGLSFTVSGRSRDQRVSGSIAVEPVKNDPRALGPLLGVSVRYSGASWEIGTR